MYIHIQTYIQPCGLLTFNFAAMADIYMYIYMRIYLRVYMNTCVRTYRYLHVYMNIHEQISACIYT